jgi:hypothetical protein
MRSVARYDAGAGITTLMVSLQVKCTPAPAS